MNEIIMSEINNNNNNIKIDEDGYIYRKPNSKTARMGGCLSFVVPPPTSPEPATQPVLERQSTEIFLSSDSDNGGIISAPRMQTHNPAQLHTYKLCMEFDLQIMVSDSRCSSLTATLDHFSVSQKHY